VLARMKELEALQDVLHGAKATFLFGKGDLVEQVRSLTGGDGSLSASDGSAGGNRGPGESADA
jgi:hypothetical protein